MIAHSSKGVLCSWLLGLWLCFSLFCFTNIKDTYAAHAEPGSSVGKRVITWCGLEWFVKDSADKRVGPGPNYFSASEHNVFVDGRGRLHLKVTRAKDEDDRTRWLCAELVSKRSFAYGVYRWYLDTPIHADPNVVFGLFTWDKTSGEEHHREIDIELISTWGDANSETNAQYVVQPWEVRGRRKRWAMPEAKDAAMSTHSFTWRADSVEFLSMSGHRAATDQAAILQSWVFRGRDIPTPGRENVRMNLWLLKQPSGEAPETEAIISRFEFDAITNEAPTKKGFK